MNLCRECSRNQSGFTLIEILVVLVIVGMISSVVVTGLAQVFSLRERLGPLVDQSDRTALIGSWYRKHVKGIIPDVRDGKYVFKGGPRQFTGLSNMTIGADAGVPTPFNMVIFESGGGKFALQIHNVESNSDITLLTWRSDQDGSADAGFQYFDGTEWSPVWPMPTKLAAARQPLQPGNLFSIDPPPQIPKLIRADIIMDGQRMVLVAAPGGPDQPVPRLQDILR